MHGELRRAYRAFITCWQTETGLLLPTGMLPAPYGLALPQSAHFVAVAISADIAVVSSSNQGVAAAFAGRFRFS